MSNVMKFQAPFERMKIYNEAPEISLFKSVITQAIIDASNISNLKEAKKLELEAKIWLFNENEDFKEICLLVGLKASWVRRIATKTIELHKLSQNKCNRSIYVNKFAKKNIAKSIKKKEN